MAFQVSPGVLVREKDLTNVIPAVATSIGAFAGDFTQGPLDEIVTVGSESELVEQFLPESTMPEDEDLLGGFKSRFLQNRTQEEREAIEKIINEKFKYDYNSFGLGDMDGS